MRSRYLADGQLADFREGVCSMQLVACLQALLKIQILVPA
jgi:hypothetical protein